MQSVRTCTVNNTMNGAIEGVNTIYLKRQNKTSTVHAYSGIEQLSDEFPLRERLASSCIRRGARVEVFSEREQPLGNFDPSSMGLRGYMMEAIHSSTILI